MKQKTVDVGDFVRLMDSSYAKDGIKKGDVLYLAGDAIVSVTEKDPYALRRIFIATTVIDGHIQAKGVKPFTVDGKRLEKLGKAVQEKLNAIKMEDFGDKEENEDQSIN